MEMKDILKQHVDAFEAKLAGNDRAIAEVKFMMHDVEQKMARASSHAFGTPAQSYGGQFVDSPNFKSFQADSYQGKVRIELKEITAAESGAFSARDTEVVGLARRQLRVRDLLTVVPTDSGSVDYVRQTTHINAAASVVEGALKPYSDYAWEQVNLPMRTIAHLAKITRQALDDNRQLQAEIDSEMRYGLGRAEEAQLLNGSGAGVNLTGLVTNATAYSPPFDPAGVETMIDQVGLAILQQSLTEFETDGVVMHPSDWMRIRLIKDTDGNYILGDPGADVPQVLFGRPVVTTQAMTIDKFLVGGFKRQKLYDRLSPEVLISSENDKDFEMNLFTMRCEERIGLAIRQPTALVFADFGNIV